jgi:uncharacterized membrane protein (UPF0127 family)
MNWIRSIELALVVAVGVTACKPTSNSEVKPVSEIDPVRGHLLHAQPKLHTVKIWLGDQELIAEVARKPVEIATGMMFRTNMLENEAMLFVFSDASRRSFYMRNCVVPLSAAYISPAGEVLETIDMNPGDETGVASASDNVQFVLEVPQGWFSRHNVTTGAVVRTQDGTLRETFFGRQ